jgi:hypothetical protein
MAPVDGSASNAVVVLGCGVIKRRGAAVDSVAAVRGCTDGGMKKGGELRCVASKGDTTGCMLGTWRQQRHTASASEARWRGWDGAVETDWVGTVALGRAQFVAQCCFSNYSNFA